MTESVKVGGKIFCESGFLVLQSGSFVVVPSERTVFASVLP